MDFNDGVVQESVAESIDPDAELTSVESEPYDPTESEPACSYVNIYADNSHSDADVDNPDDEVLQLMN